LGGSEFLPAIFEAFPELRAFQQDYHRQHLNGSLSDAKLRNKLQRKSYAALSFRATLLDCFSVLFYWASMIWPAYDSRERYSSSLAFLLTEYLPALTLTLKNATVAHQRGKFFAAMAVTLTSL